MEGLNPNQLDYGCTKTTNKDVIYNAFFRRPKQIRHRDWMGNPSIWLI